MLLTAEQVAEKLACGVQKVRDLCKAGKLQAVNVASEGSSRNSWRVDEKALREWRTAQRNGSNGTVVVPPATTPPAPPQGYVDAEEAMRITGVKVSTLYGRIAKGHVESVKVDGRRYFKVASIAKRGAVKTEPAVVATQAAEPAKLAEAVPPRLMYLLGNIIGRLERIETDIAALLKVWQA